MIDKNVTSETNSVILILILINSRIQEFNHED